MNVLITSTGLKVGVNVKHISNVLKKNTNLGLMKVNKFAYCALMPWNLVTHVV